ncbi:MAG: DUF1353 domain-containing protein [Demequinaceae bacterium]|nr:DUF1353 domain-containing protein [Demequinaceae bacterium]
MPFTPDHVHLEHSTGQTFRLTKDLVYRARGGHRYIARAGLTTDMASIPRALWSVIAPFGRQSLPAILHDQECDDLRTLRPQRSRTRRLQRRPIDARLHEALLERGVPRFRATMMWAGACLGRYWEHGGYIQRLWLFVQLALGYAAIVWGSFHLDGWPGWVALAAPAVAALAWGRAYPAVLLTQYPGFVIITIGLVIFVFSMLDWIPNVIFGARVYEPSPEQAEIEEEAAGGHRGRRRGGKRPFRGVGFPPGLRLLPR